MDLGLCEIFFLSICMMQIHHTIAHNQINLGRPSILNDSVTVRVCLFVLDFASCNTWGIARTRRVFFSVFILLFHVFHSVSHAYSKPTFISTLFYSNTHSYILHTVVFISQRIYSSPQYNGKTYS